MTAAEENEQRPKPAKGLSNLGNTCFYNSTMQCLMHTHSLYSWQELVTEKTELIVKKGIVMVNEKKVEVPADVVIPLPDTQMPLVNALQHFLAEFRTGRSPNPQPLFSQISLKAPRFRGWAQQDSHELLRYLLDGIRTEELKRYRDGILAHLGVEGKPDPEKAALCRAMLDSTDCCYVDSIFGGSLLQSIKCSQCGHVSNSLEPFLDLSLPLNYGVPATPQVHFPPRNRREGTPSKHQTKKAQKKAKKEARARKNKNKNVAIDENNGISNTDTMDHSNMMSTCDPPLVEFGPKERADVGDDDEIKALNVHSDTDEASSAEDMSVSDENDNDENANGIEECENQEMLPIQNGKESSSPNYSLVLSSPDTAEEDKVGEERTVINSLRQFTASESLCASNAYECENCCNPHNKKLPPNSKDKKTVEASKQYLIYSPPCVLTVHLKRFEQVATFGRMRTRKIRGHVEFPFVLNIAPFCSKNGQRISPGQNEVLYSLYGIVSHSGDLGGGHYIAYVKTRNRVEILKQFMEAGMKPDRLSQTMEELQQQPRINLSTNKDEVLKQLDEGAIWYYCSDSHVRTVTVNEVKTAEAYILFYERVC